MWVSRLSRHRTSTACTVEDAISSRSPISTGPSRCFHRRCTILRTTGAGVRFGGGGAARNGRSSRPHLRPGSGQPILGGLPRHVVPLRGTGRGPPLIDDQPGQLEPGTWRQSSIGMGSVGHEGLLGVKRFLDSSTPHREAFTHPEPQIVSSQDLDQRAWASHLGERSGSRPRAAQSGPERPRAAQAGHQGGGRVRPCLASLARPRAAQSTGPRHAARPPRIAAWVCYIEGDGRGSDTTTGGRGPPARHPAHVVPGAFRRTRAPGAPDETRRKHSSALPPVPRTARPGVAALAGAGPRGSAAPPSPNTAFREPLRWCDGPTLSG